MKRNRNVKSKFFRPWETSAPKSTLRRLMPPGVSEPWKQSEQSITAFNQKQTQAVVISCIIMGQNLNFMRGWLDTVSPESRLSSQRDLSEWKWRDMNYAVRIVFESEKRKQSSRWLFATTVLLFDRKTGKTLFSCRPDIPVVPSLDQIFSRLCAAFVPEELDRWWFSTCKQSLQNSRSDYFVLCAKLRPELLAPAP